jgi:hypothetical protein
MENIEQIVAKENITPRMLNKSRKQGKCSDGGNCWAVSINITAVNKNDKIV